MLKNIIKIIFRTFKRQKSYTLINIIGLATGLAVFILIALFINDEWSYDRFHTKADRIFRMSENVNWTGKWDKTTMTSAPMGPAMIHDYPEVEDAVRIMPWFKATLHYNDKSFSEYPYFADASIFNIFTLPMVYGNSSAALREKNTVTLSQTFARKFFGDENPVGKIISYNGNIALKVDGVFEDVPHNSHMSFDVLVSFETLTDTMLIGQEGLNSWESHNNYTYLLLKDAGKAAQLEKKFPVFIEKYFGKDGLKKFLPFLEPITSIHLNPQKSSSKELSIVNLDYIKIFTLTGIFILLLACINYMNLATARSDLRAREVGIRKVMGATRGQIMKSFFAESLVFTFFAFIIAISLAEICLPVFRNITQKPLYLPAIFEWKFLLFLLGVSFVTGSIAGAWSAFYLSGCQPVIVLKGKIVSYKGQSVIRKILVVFQFSVSVFLIVTSLSVYRQLHYMKNCDLGFDKENMIFLELNSPNVKNKLKTLKQELLQNPEIKHVSASFYIIGRGGGLWNVKTPKMKEYTTMVTYMVDPDFVKTFNLKIKAGRDFLQNSPKDCETAFLLNEQAVKKLELNEGVNGQIDIQDKHGIVVGVVKDFHFESLHNTTEPLIITLNTVPELFHFLNIKIEPGNFKETIAFIEKKWKEIEPTQPFNYRFLDATLDRMYGTEERLAKIILVFTVLAILIGCMGLLGLTMFTVEQKTREIGIRKIFGGSGYKIFITIIRDFFPWILVSIMIASPLAYFAVLRWLETFAYNKAPDWKIFVYTAGIVLLSGIITIGYQVNKAMKINPVKALKYE